MLPSLVLVLISIALGDLVTAALHVPIPGSVLGLVAAAAFFAWRGEPTSSMGSMFDLLIPHAPLLFVPAGAGLVAHFDLLASSWLPIVAATVLGTAGALVATGIAAQLLMQRFLQAETDR